MSYIIRLATADDVSSIADLTNQEARRSAATVASSEEPVERWREGFRRDHVYTPWLVAVEEGLSGSKKVIAYAKASPYNQRDGFRWSVTLSIYVDHVHKGKSIGKNLYERLFALLKCQGYLHVYARIALPNPASQNLHERLGLTQTGLLPSFAWKFGVWHDMAIYTGCLHPEKTMVEPKALLTVIEAWNLLDDQDHSSAAKRSTLLSD